MSETRRIRVIRAEAADPKLIVTLESTDGGTFPDYVSVSAHLTNQVDGGSYYGGPAQAATNGSLTQVTITIPFPDPNYNYEDSLNYHINVSFSSDDTNWLMLSDSQVEGNSGSVIIVHGP